MSAQKNSLFVLLVNFWMLFNIWDLYNGIDLKGRGTFKILSPKAFFFLKSVCCVVKLGVPSKSWTFGKKLKKKKKNRFVREILNNSSTWEKGKDISSSP
jgi:hypothetical protein